MRLSWDTTSRCFLFLLCVCSAGGISAKDEPNEWPPITPEEMALKDCPGNPGAPAMILYRTDHTDDNKRFETHYFRIKIFTDEGKKYADIEIPYAPKVAEVEDIKARIVRPDGTTVDFRGEIFDRMVVKARGLKVQAKTFTLPDIQRGSILEYSYKVRWREKWPDTLLHPSEYIFKIVDSIPTGRWEVQHELFTQKALFTLQPVPQAHLRYTSVGLPLGATPYYRLPDGNLALEIQNLPGFQEEPYMPPEDAVKSHVDLFYVLGDSTSDGGFWNSVGHVISDRLERFIGNSKSVEKEAAALASPIDPPETKLRKIYERVQQIRYLSFEPSKTEQEEKHENIKDNTSAEDVLKHGYATANQINFLFVALARALGSEAYVVLVAPRNREFFNREWFDPRQLTAQVVAVRVGSGYFFVDPATRFCPFALLPWEESAAGGIILKPNATAVGATPKPASADAVRERRANLELAPDGNLQGTVLVDYIGQEALKRRLESVAKDDAGRRKQLEDEAKSWLPPGSTVEVANIKNMENSDDKLSVELHVKAQNLGTSTGRRLLLPAGVFQANEKNPFQAEKRVHPIYFDYPYQEIDDVVVHLPKDYPVESLPRSFTVGQGPLTYEIGLEVRSDGLHMRRRLMVDAFTFGVGAYPEVRQFFREVKAGDEEQVVLKKTDTIQPK